MANNPEDIAHSHIEKTKKQLQHPDVVNALGNDAARRLLGLADELYVPTINADRSLEVKPEGIPLVVLNPEEQVVLSGDSLGIRPVQFEAMNKKGVPVSAQAAMDQSLHPQRAITMTKDSGGKTLYRHGHYTSNSGKDFLVRGAPVLAISSDLDMRPGYDTIAAHELVHAGQILSRPYQLRQPHPKVTSELQAYRVQAAIDSTLHGEEANTRAQRVMKHLEQWQADGRSLDTPEDKLAFERWLRQHKMGVLSLRIKL